MAIAILMNGFFFFFGFFVAMLVGLQVATDVVDDGRSVEVLVVGVDGVVLPLVVGVDGVVEVVVVLFVVVGGACPQLVAFRDVIGIPPEHLMFCTYGE